MRGLSAKDSVSDASRGVNPRSKASDRRRYPVFRADGAPGDRCVQTSPPHKAVKGFPLAIDYILRSQV